MINDPIQLFPAPFLTMVRNIALSGSLKGAWRLLTATSLVACAGGPVTRAAPGSTVPASYISVEMANGYGLDRNGNGIVDIPNTVAYVQRPLHTKLNFTSVALFTPTVWPVPDGNNTLVWPTQGPWRWTLTPVDVPQDETLLPAPASAYATAPSRNTGGTIITYTENPVLELDLFEGTWRVEFARMSAGSLDGSPIYWSNVTLPIEDYLIVALGDSYASGEGASENSAHPGWGVWADDGSGAHPRVSNYSSCWASPERNGIEPTFPNSVSISELECLREKAYGTQENFQHELAHRSSLSWPSLAALDVENWTTGTSVTFVDLAASGSRISHLTQEKADLPPLVPPAASGGLTSDGAGPHLQRGSASGGALTKLVLPPQLAKLQELIGPRHPDVVLLSIGGNDIGFASLIVAYLLRDSDEDDYYPVIEGALASGSWAPVGDYTFEARHADWHWPDLRGLVGLPNGYQVANNALVAAGILPENVYIIEYPDPLVATTAKLKGSHADDQIEVCPGPILTGVGDANFMGISVHDADVGKGEQRHMRGAFLHPLNELIWTATQTHGWNIVGQVMESMYRNPICSSSRMVVKGEGQSMELQGDNYGMIHPNKIGQQRIASYVEAHLPMPSAWREAMEYEDQLKAPDRHYSAHPNHLVYSIVSQPGPNTALDWLSVGLPLTPSRAFIDVPPNLCNWGTITIDAREAHDYTYDNQRYLVEPFRIDNAVLRLFRVVSGSPTEVNRLVGYGSLTYSLTEADKANNVKFTLIASTPSNSETAPIRFARVHGKRTRSDEYGTFEIRARCG